MRKRRLRPARQLARGQVQLRRRSQASPVEPGASGFPPLPTPRRRENPLTSAGQARTTPDVVQAEARRGRVLPRAPLPHWSVEPAGSCPCPFCHPAQKARVSTGEAWKRRPGASAQNEVSACDLAWTGLLPQRNSSINQCGNSGNESCLC